MKIGKRLYSILMVGLLLVSQINPNFVMAEELQQEPISEPEAVEETSKQSEIEVQDETPIPEEVIEEKQNFQKKNNYQKNLSLWKMKLLKKKIQKQLM